MLSFISGGVLVRSGWGSLKIGNRASGARPESRNRTKTKLEVGRTVTRLAAQSVRTSPLSSDGAPDSSPGAKIPDAPFCFPRSIGLRLSG